MALPAKAAGQKRAADTQARSITHKRRRVDIPTQNGVPGELNIATFVKAREYEISALETSMRKARKGLMSRAFQQVPRNMRRRTASHNVKKVPRRLRGRALREMKDDNTPTVTKRTRTPSRQLRLRLQTAKTLKALNQRAKTVRQKKREAKANAKESDPDKHLAISRVPRVKKNKLADPPRATSKYKRRQVDKTWLPTHLWHTKRAHMTRPTEPLWRIAIPISPTEKSYRPSHRAANARGCLSWDTSFVSTVACSGTDHTLEGMLKALGYSGEGWSGSRYKRWKAGTRHSRGWIAERDGDKAPVAPVTIFWCAAESLAKTKPTKKENLTVDDEDTAMTEETRPPSKKTKLDRKLFIRIHPSAFHQFWIELLQAAKVQKPQVLVEDLRFEIGSIEVRGPGSTEALLGVLRPSQNLDKPDSVEQVWQSLAGLSNPASLPAQALLAFEVVDPRLSHPPKQLAIPTDDSSLNALNNLLVVWPLDRTQSSPKLSSHKSRWVASHSLASQKAINRRRALAPPGQPASPTEKDPQIPVVVLASRPITKGTNLQGSWTVLLPWKCVDPIWRSLLYYPLTSGGTPRFGGLHQMQQAAFEHTSPWFPGDMPGTESGKAWERTQCEKRFDRWIRRPPSRRLAWELVDLGMERSGEIGRGWACDWEFLLDKKGDTQKVEGPPQHPVRTKEESSAKVKNKPLTARQRKALKNAVESTAQPQGRRNTSSPEPDSDPDMTGSEMNILEEPVKFTQLSPPAASQIFMQPISASLPTTETLATIRIRLLTKGTPKAAARIYRLPTALSRKVPATQEASQPQPPNNTSPDPTTETLAFNPTLSLPQSASTDFTSILRSKWLRLAATTQHKPQQSPKPVSKTRENHHHLPRLHQTHASPTRALSKIHVLPKDAPAEAIAEYGPKHRTEEDLAEERREALMRELAKGDAVSGGWDWGDEGGVHIPCPDAHDLIGFVTSGGYNLTEGRGTAVGGVWVQRVLRGWIAEDENAKEDNDAGEKDGSQKGMMTVAEQSKKKAVGEKKRRDWERHLCIVRNAGESVARLGIWELC